MPPRETHAHMHRNLIARWSNPHFFFAAEKGGGTGGGAETPKEPTTLAEAKAEIARAREEAKGANEARTAAEKERDDVKAENTRLTEQFNAATTTTTKAQADLKAANEQVTALTTEKADLNTKLTTANENVTRLEKLCGLNGVDPAAAVPAQPLNAGGANAGVYDQWAKATGAEKTTLYRANKEAIRAEHARRAKGL